MNGKIIKQIVEGRNYRQKITRKFMNGMKGRCDKIFRKDQSSLQREPYFCLRIYILVFFLKFLYTYQMKTKFKRIIDDILF